VGLHNRGKSLEKKRGEAWKNCKRGLGLLVRAREGDLKRFDWG